jgi:hypothetical protein
MDDGVGGSVTRQRWLTSSQRRAQGARDRRPASPSIREQRWPTEKRDGKIACAGNPSWGH